MAYAASDAITAGNVKVAVTGAVYVADADDAAATAPTTAVSKLATGWKSVGYISEEGVVEANTRDTNEITAWQNSDVVRKTVTKSETTYQFTMIETNATALGLFYGKDIADAATKHTIGGSASKKVKLVIDVVDGGKVIRRYIPDGEVTERGEVTFSASDALGYQVTVTAYPNAALGGSVEVHYDTALEDGLADTTTP